MRNVTQIVDSFTGFAGHFIQLRLRNAKTKQEVIDPTCQCISPIENADIIAIRQIKLKKAYGLSDREVDVALMLADGFTNRQIASAMKLSDGTARNYISSIYLKLGVDSRMNAIAKIKEIT